MIALITKFISPYLNYIKLGVFIVVLLLLVIVFFRVRSYINEHDSYKQQVTSLTEKLDKVSDINNENKKTYETNLKTQKQNADIAIKESEDYKNRAEKYRKLLEKALNSSDNSKVSSVVKEMVDDLWK
jgi:cell shape-determining protein MreC